jgi:hypothetical protein
MHRIRQLHSFPDHPHWVGAAFRRPGHIHSQGNAGNASFGWSDSNRVSDLHVVYVFGNGWTWEMNGPNITFHGTAYRRP